MTFLPRFGFFFSHLKSSQTPEKDGLYTMYHGTSVSNAMSIIDNGFRQSTKGMLGRGVYVSRDPEKASRYPLNLDPSERVVLKLIVKVGRVKRIDVDDHPMQFTWHDHGYNTAWVPPNCGMKSVPCGLEEDCVFDPERIRIVDVERAPPSVIHKLKMHITFNVTVASLMKPSQTPEEGLAFIKFHGTSIDFRQSTKGMLGRGVYVSRDPEITSVIILLCL